MKIAILGATGFVGSYVLQAALNAGYEVKALVRTPSKLGDFAQKIEVIQGDFSDEAALAKTISSVDAVLSATGPTNHPGQPELFRDAMEKLVRVMDNAGVKRLVILAGAGSLIMPQDHLTFQRKFMRFVMGVMGKYVTAAKVAEYEVLSKSNLDWTIIRMPMVTKEESTGILADGINLVGMNLSAKDAATFMLDQLTDKAWVGKGPMVASKK